MKLLFKSFARLTEALGLVCHKLHAAKADMVSMPSDCPEEQTPWWRVYRRYCIFPSKRKFKLWGINCSQWILVIPKMITNDLTKMNHRSLRLANPRKPSSTQYKCLWRTTCGNLTPRMKSSKKILSDTWLLPHKRSSCQFQHAVGAKTRQEARDSWM